MTAESGFERDWMPVNSVRDIVAFTVGLADDWYPMPLSESATPEWPEQLAVTVVADDAKRSKLADELRSARGRLASMDDPRLTAAVWIPFPDTGRPSAAVVFELTPLTSVGSPDIFETFLDSYRDREESGENYYSVQTWRSAIDAGEVVGSHNLIAHLSDDPNGAVLEERVVLAVFVPGAAQVVQFIFSAENLGAFVNMPREAEEFASSLQLTLGDAA